MRAIQIRIDSTELCATFESTHSVHSRGQWMEGLLLVLAAVWQWRRWLSNTTRPKSLECHMRKYSLHQRLSSPNHMTFTSNISGFTLLSRLHGDRYQTSWSWQSRRIGQHRQLRIHLGGWRWFCSFSTKELAIGATSYRTTEIAVDLLQWDDVPGTQQKWRCKQVDRSFHECWKSACSAIIHIIAKHCVRLRSRWIGRPLQSFHLLRYDGASGGGLPAIANRHIGSRHDNASATEFRWRQSNWR